MVTLPGSGTLAVSGSAVSADQEVAASDLGGNLTFTPAADGHGSGYASFTFRVSDGTAESAADYTMTIDVNSGERRAHCRGRDGDDGRGHRIRIRRE